MHKRDKINLFDQSSRWYSWLISYFSYLCIFFEINKFSLFFKRNEKEPYEFRLNYKDENMSESDMCDIFKRMSKGDPKGVDFANFKKNSLW